MRVTVCLALFVLVLTASPAYASSNTKLNKNEAPWKITAYCSCSKCCGKSDGIMASRKKVYRGAVALNWLPFGTKVKIGNETYTVEDRGAESHFGTYYHRRGPKKQIKHIDIWIPSHSEARKFGVKYLPVTILAPARSHTIANSERPLARSLQV